MQAIKDRIKSLARAEARRKELIERQAPAIVIATETVNIRRKVAELRFLVALVAALAPYSTETNAELAA